MIFVIFPLVGALIGWLTNYIAIRLLFRPLEPFRLWPFPVSFQGLIPKRREQIAETVGQVVAEQLFSVGELTTHLNMPELQKEVDRSVRKAVERWCGGKLNLLPGALREYCSSYLRDTVAAEVAALFPQIAGSVLNRMSNQIDVRQVVAEKIKGLSLKEVEQIVLTVARRELKQIEWLGAVIGLLIGLFQAFFVYFFSFA